MKDIPLELIKNILAADETITKGKAGDIRTVRFFFQMALPPANTKTIKKMEKRLEFLLQSYYCYG